MMHRKRFKRTGVLAMLMVFSGLCGYFYASGGLSQQHALAQQPRPGSSERLHPTPAPLGNAVVSQHTVPWVNVRDFGAVGDGQQDDTAAFQRALDTKRPVLIPQPDNVFVVSKTLYVNTHQTVMGLGKGMSIVKYVGTDSCFMSDPNYNRKHHNITFHNFTILGTGNAAAHGITLVRANNASIENVHIDDIGGIGVIIDGEKKGGIAQSHYAFMQNVEITGNHKIGIQLRGRGKEEGANRHRIFFVRDNGATEVALDFWKQANTSTIYGFAAENVRSAMRIAGRHNLFYGLHVESVIGHGVEFLPDAGNNIFYGAKMSKVGGEKWANPQYNPVQTVEDEFEDDADIEGEATSQAVSRGAEDAERIEVIKKFVR